MAGPAESTKWGKLYQQHRAQRLLNFLREPMTPVVQGTSAQDDHAKTFMHKLSSAINKAEYSDLVISCLGHEWKVHRVLVCSQVAFFEGALRSGMQESITKTIDLADDLPHAVEALLVFLYTGDYKLPDKLPEAGASGYEFHAQIYSIADKYQMIPLVNLATQKFHDHATQSWNALEFIDCAEKICHNEYGNTSGLREIVGDLFLEHVKEFTTDSVEDKTFDLEKYPGITVEAMRSIGKDKQKSDRYTAKFTCDACSKEFVFGIYPVVHCPFCGERSLPRGILKG